ncbi:hypothetical protein KQI84_18795 [bacterium]|nr:hypothetical protein [bacterium]
MAQLRTKEGQVIDLGTLPEDENDLVEAVLEVDVVLDDLAEDEAQIAEETFVEDLQSYMSDVFSLRKPPEVTFADKGMIGDTAYWVFESTPVEELPLYLFVIRNRMISEIVCGERSAFYVDQDSGTMYDRLLTPAQAALLEFVSTDSHTVLE